jgi:hypothetical protein
MAVKRINLTKKEENDETVIVGEEENTNEDLNDQNDGENEEGIEVQIISDDLKQKVTDAQAENDPIDSETTEEVIVTQVEEVVVEKNVKIKMKADHKCYIGGTWYYLLKEKTYTVPEQVKEILANAGLLLPL